MTSVKAPTFFLFGSMFFYGTASVMIGTLLPELIGSFGLTMARGGLIVTLQNLGGLGAALAGSLLADRGHKPTLTAVAFLFMAAAVFSIGFAASYPMVLVLFFLSGIAVRLLDTMLNAYLGDLRSERRGMYMNLLHMFFGIGAFAGPLWARLLLSGGMRWTGVYITTGLVCAAVSIPGLLMAGRFPVGRAASNRPAGGPADTVKMLANPSILFVCAALLLYVMHQMGMTAWLPHYLGSRLGLSPGLSSFGLSLYWIGIIASRLLASRIPDTVSPPVLIAGGAAAGGLLLTAGLLSSSPALFLVSAVLAGILTGAVIPLTLVVAHGWYPERTGSVTSLFFVFMMGGRLMSPWLIGTIGDSAGLEIGMLLNGVTLLGCALTAAGAAAFSRKRRYPV